MTGLINTLRTYGEARTSQNVVLRTLPGTEVKIRSGNSVPYVSGISSSIGSDSGSSTTSNVDIDTVETGLTMTMLPNLDAKSGIVTMAVEMELKSLLGFIEVSGGNDAGTFSQPNTQEQSFNDIARLSLGDTVVLGGVTFDSINDARTSMAGLEKLPVGNQKDSHKREALFIVIRPTAVMYKFNADGDIQSRQDEVNRQSLFNSVETVKTQASSPVVDSKEEASLKELAQVSAPVNVDEENTDSLDQESAKDKQALLEAAKAADSVTRVDEKKHVKPVKSIVDTKPEKSVVDDIIENDTRKVPSPLSSEAVIKNQRFPKVKESKSVQVNAVGHAHVEAKEVPFEEKP
jgi:hypothetical protein